MAQAPSSTHPPVSRENTPSRDVALLLGGQNPKTLEYQIYPPSTSIDTLVTGMASRAPDPYWQVGEWRWHIAYNFNDIHCISSLSSVFPTCWVEISLESHNNCLISRSNIRSTASRCPVKLTFSYTVVVVSFLGTIQLDISY